MIKNPHPRSSRKTMKFYKMHGIGNDYIYFDCMKEQLKNPEKLAVKLNTEKVY